MASGGEDGWLRAERLTEAAAPAMGSTAAMFELRPLSLGELLDRIFALYRSRFWLFASLAVLPAAIRALMQAIALTTVHRAFPGLLPVTPGARAQPLPLGTFVSGQLWTWAAGLLFFLVSAVTQAATSLALSRVYLNQPVDARESLRVAGRQWLRWIGIALWQVWSLIWVMVALLVPAVVVLTYGTRTGATGLSVVGFVLFFAAMLGGLPIGVVLYLRNALALPAAMIEGLKVRTAMRRSKGLSGGTKGRIFVVLLIAACLHWVVGLLESPATILIMFSPRQEHYLARAITLLVSFVGLSAVLPVAMIGLTLVYFDQRVRKEAFDLQLLLEGAGAVPGAQDAQVGGNGNLGTAEGLTPLG